MPRFIAAAAAAAFAAVSAFAADPINIGISIAQSPPGSVVQGTQVKDGVEIVKDMINAKGGALGRPINLIYEDNQGVPEKGRDAAEKLITRDNFQLTDVNQPVSKSNLIQGPGGKLDVSKLQKPK